MAKKSIHQYIKPCLNLDGIKKVIFVDPKNSDPEELRDLARQRCYYDKLSWKKIKEGNFDPRFLCLCGKKGERAYVRDDTPFEDRHKKKRYTFVIEFPAATFVVGDKQRKFISTIADVFKKELISELETIKLGERFKRITNGAYSSREIDISKNIRFLSRYRTCANRQLNKTELAKNHRTRNKWIKSQYKKYRKKKCKSIVAIMQIQKDLKGMWDKNKYLFGYKSSLYKITLDTIKKIIFP